MEARSVRLHGDVLIVPRVSHRLILCLFLLWLSGVLYWLTHSTYARKETVQGWLQPPSGITRVYAGMDGIIEQVLVEEGERVFDDQALIVIEGVNVLANGQRLESELMDEYAIQQSVLAEQLTRSRGTFRQQAQDIAQRIETAEDDLALLDEQIAILNQHRSLLSGQVTRYRDLSRAGHVSSADLEAVTNQELALRSEIQALRRNRVNQQNRIEQLRIEQSILPREHADATATLTMRLSDISQQITRLRGQQARTITATRDGIVHNLQAVPGQRTNAVGVPLMSLTPQDEVFSAQLLVPVRAAGFISVGQSLNIRYDAFPYQKFGLYKGTVTEVSQTVQLPHEVLDTPFALREAVFRVSATINSPTVQAYGQELSLKAGMTLSADIELSDRSLLQWLLEPLYTLKGRL